jgi:catechol 2,3-dioxygenase-like lactoylglutathione lyase family enzyme
VLDHVALEVDDLSRAARFYDALMHPLGGRRIVDSPDGIGYGRDRPELWIMPRRVDGRAARQGDAERSRGGGAGARGGGADARGGSAEARGNGAHGSGAARTRNGHVAIAAAGRRAVDAAHKAGLAAGGRDGGAPAPRAIGPPNYYSGYLVDPDGAWLELVSGSQ